jgi:hypothetical protein
VLKEHREHKGLKVLNQRVFNMMGVREVIVVMLVT